MNPTPSDRRQHDDERNQLLAIIDQIRKEQAEFRTELKKNSDITASNHAMMQEMVTIFTVGKGAFTFFGWIATAIKWIAALTIAIGGIYAFFYAMAHGLTPPK